MSIFMLLFSQPKRLRKLSTVCITAIQIFVSSTFAYSPVDSTPAVVEWPKEDEALSVVNISTPTGSLTTYVANNSAQVEQMVDLLQDEVAKSPGGLGGVLLPTPEYEELDPTLVNIAKKIKPGIIREKIQKLLIPREGYKEWFSKTENRTRVICTSIRSVGVGAATGLIMYSRYGNVRGAVALGVITAIQSGLLSWNTVPYITWLDHNNNHLTKKFGVDEGSSLGETLVSAERLNKFFFTEALYAIPMVMAMAATGIPITSFHAFLLASLSGTLTQGAVETGSGINFKIDKRQLRKLNPFERKKAKARAKNVAMILGTTASVIEVTSAALQMAGGTSDMISTGGFLVLGLFGWTVFTRGLIRQKKLRDLKKDVTTRRQMGRKLRMTDPIQSSTNSPKYSEIYHFDWNPPKPTYTGNNPTIYGSTFNLNWPSEKSINHRTFGTRLKCSNFFN